MTTIISKDIQSLVETDKILDAYIVKRKILWGSDGTANDVSTSTPLPVTDVNVPSQRSSTSSINRINSSASSVILLSQNTSRLSAVLYNDSTQICYVKFGSIASTSSFTIAMDPKSTLILEENPIYTGEIDGIWASVNGAMQVTELTA